MDEIKVTRLILVGFFLLAVVAIPLSFAYFDTLDELHINIKNVDDEPRDVSLYIDGDCVYEDTIAPNKVAVYVLEENFLVFNEDRHFTLTVISGNTTLIEDAGDYGDVWFIIGA